MIVGLTGGIGSGKTWVSSLFKDLGIAVYISDIEAKKIMNENILVKNAIIDLFGSESYIDDKLNRSFISDKVFNDKDSLEQLNNIVHPAVANHFNEWYKNQKSIFVIKESAILFETGAQKKCDYTILVTAPVDERIKRVKARDNATRKNIEARINNQWLDQKKIPLADFIINNTKKENTIKRVSGVYEIIKALV